MQQRRPPFIAALIFISFPFLAVYVSALAQTGALSHHPQVGIQLGHHRSGGIGHAQQNQNANANHYKRYSVGNAYQNQQQSQVGITYGDHSNGIGKAHQNQNQYQGQAGIAIRHHSGGIGNAHQNQNQNQQQGQGGMTNNGYPSCGIGNAPQNQNQQQSQAGIANNGHQLGGIINALQNQNQQSGQAGIANRHHLGNIKNAHQNQNQQPGQVGITNEHQLGGIGNSHQNQNQQQSQVGMGNNGQHSSGIQNAHQNQQQNQVGMANNGQHSSGIQNAHQNQNQQQSQVGMANNRQHSSGIQNAPQNQSQQLQVGQAGIPHGNYSGDNANVNQNLVQAGNSNSGRGTGNNGNHNQSGSGNGIVVDHGKGQGGTNAPVGLVQEFLLAHNLVRKMFNEPFFTWDEELALYAQAYATKLYHECKMIHSNGSYGENIFWGLNLHWTPSAAVKFWYEEYKHYDFNKHNCATGKKCGHFTQMVWRDSVRLGCAVSHCRPGTGMLIICEYDPPGNFENENPFDNNNAKQ